MSTGGYATTRRLAWRACDDDDDATSCHAIDVLCRLYADMPTQSPPRMSGVCPHTSWKLPCMPPPVMATIIRPHLLSPCMPPLALRGSATYFRSPETVFTIKRRVLEFKTRATILYTRMKKEENKSSDNPIRHTIEKEKKAS